MNKIWLGCLLIYSQIVQAGFYTDPVWSARQIGSNSLTAYAADGLAALSNPALLANITEQNEIGGSVAFYKRYFEYSGSVANGWTGDRLKDNSQQRFAPYVSVVNSFDDIHYSISLLLSPEFISKYSRSDSIYSVNNQQLGFDVQQLRLSPAVAKVFGSHTVGLTVSFIQQRTRVSGVSRFTSTQPSSLSNNGASYSYGASTVLGWKYTGLNTTFGFAVESPSWLTNDRYHGFFANQLNTPPRIRGGISHKTTNLNISFDVERIFYSAIRALKNPINTANSFGGNDGSGFGWSNRWRIAGTLDYQFSKRWMLRGGLTYFTPQQPVTLNELVHSPQLIFGLGVTLKPSFLTEYTLGYRCHLPDSRQGLSKLGLGAQRLNHSQHQLAVSVNWA